MSTAYDVFGSYANDFMKDPNLPTNHPQGAIISIPDRIPKAIDRERWSSDNDIALCGLYHTNYDLTSDPGLVIIPKDLLGESDYSSLAEQPKLSIKFLSKEDYNA